MNRRNSSLTLFIVFALVAGATGLNCGRSGAPPDLGAGGGGGGAVMAPAQKHATAVSAGLRAAYLASVQAGASKAFHANRAGGRLVAANPAQRFSSAFSSSGIEITGDGGRFAATVALSG